MGGGIIAVLPGQLGIGVFSPALDERGNSVRGVKACEAISRDLGLHFLQPPRVTGATVRASYTLAELRSKRRRSPEESRLLAAHGSEVRVFELQGDLHFATVEPVLRALIDDARPLRHAVLDFKRVTDVDRAATRMLAALIGRCAARGQHLVLTRVRRGGLLAALDTELDPRTASAFSFQPQLDLGLEWCERQLLAQHGVAKLAPGIARLAEHRLCEGAAAEDVALLESLVERRSYEPGALLVRVGDAADGLYFLMRGEVSIVVDLPSGAHKRLSTLSAGMSFGEMALLSGGRRSASARADTSVECCRLDGDAFSRIERERPTLALRLLRNMLLGTIQTALQLTGEVAALEG